jgi:cytochrome bd-type quinol oxidase subunit 2
MKTKLITRVKELSSSAKARMMARIIAVTIVTLSGVFAYSGVSLAAGADLDGVVSPIVDLINSFVNPMLALVAAGGTLFCIMLGVKFATAEEPQEKEKRKQALKTAIIGFVLIFVLIVALKLSIGPLSDWMTNSTQTSSTAATVSEDSGN